MKEIKFRQWLGKRRGYHYGIGIVKEGHWSSPVEVIFKKYPLEQFVGKYDITGRLMYEGDIVDGNLGIGVIE